MNKEVNLTEKLKQYFGFDKFKGDQEAIIRNLLDGNEHVCAYAYRRRKVVVLSVAVAHHGRHGNSDIAAHCTDEESG